MLTRHVRPVLGRIIQQWKREEAERVRACQNAEADASHVRHPRDLYDLFIHLGADGVQAWSGGDCVARANGLAETFAHDLRRWIARHGYQGRIWVVEDGGDPRPITDLAAYLSKALLDALRPHDVN